MPKSLDLIKWVDSAGTERSLGIATASVPGLVKPTSVLPAKPTIQSASGTSNRYYGVQGAPDGTMVVNVPWVNTQNEAAIRAKEVYADVPSSGVITLTGSLDDYDMITFYVADNNYAIASMTTLTSYMKIIRAPSKLYIIPYNTTDCITIVSPSTGNTSQLSVNITGTIRYLRICLWSYK